VLKHHEIHETLFTVARHSACLPAHNDVFFHRSHETSGTLKGGQAENLKQLRIDPEGSANLNLKHSDHDVARRS
jgi:hypothetical protein